MAEQGAGSQQTIDKDVEKQDQDAERRESSVNEGELYLREMGKSGASMSTAAKEVEKAGGSSTERDVLLKEEGIEAGAETAGARAVGAADFELGECSTSRDPQNDRSPMLQFRRHITAETANSGEAAEVARMAAYTARSAARLCRLIMEQTLDSQTVGQKQVEKALRRAEGAAEFDDANHYRRLAATYNAAIDSAAGKAYNVEAAADFADMTAEAAEISAGELSVVGDEPSPDERRKIQVACWAAHAANVAAIAAYKMEFIALEVMKKCWQHIDDTENTGTARENRRRQLSVYGQDCDARKEGKLLKGLQIISFLLGCGLLVSIGIFKFSTDSLYSVLSAGVVLVTWSALHALYKSWVCYKERKRQAKINETRVVIGRIESRLRDLSQYFENNSISPAISEESVEE